MKSRLFDPDDVTGLLKFDYSSIAFPFALVFRLYVKLVF